MKTSKIWKIDRTELQSVVDNCNSISHVLRILDMNFKSGGGYRTLTNRIKSDKIDLTKLEKNRKLKKYSNGKYTNDEIFIVNSPYRSHLKGRILADNLIKYECVECGNNGSHNGKKLVLQLDHRNGINDDNRLVNLRFLCPNCHTQTSTYSGKNTKKPKQKKLCIDCDKEICHTSVRCPSCSQRKLGKNRISKLKPTYDVLKSEIVSMTFVDVGKKYGVTDNAVRRWCKSYNLPHRKKDL